MKTKKLVETLESLGSNSREVAASLRELGMKQRRYEVGERKMCPIEVFLRETFPKWDPSVLSTNTVLHKEFKFFPPIQPRMETLNPEAVMQFVADFDRGFYPDLKG